MTITEEQRKELTRWRQSRTLPAGDVFRARLVLALADGQSYRQIMASLQTTAPTISRWKQRFEQAGIDGLDPLHKGSEPRVADAALHRYLASNDPQFEEKATDIIGLYLHPPQHAAVFCVDEKTAIQALDRLDPVLPLSPGRAERHGFEYFRRGTLSLYAALDVKTGQVHGMAAGRHTSKEFVAFLQGLVSQSRWAKEIHVVLDNLSGHKTPDVERFLTEHPQVRFHFTPTYILVESSGVVVRQNSTRCHSPRRVYFRCRLGK